MEDSRPHQAAALQRPYGVDLPAKRPAALLQQLAARHRRRHANRIGGNSPSPLQLALGIRPYARDGIHAALSRAGFDVSELLELPELREFTRGETASLAREVVGAEYAQLVEVLAAYSGDSPLVIVLAGQLIRTEQLDPRLLSQRDEFRDRAECLA